MSISTISDTKGFIKNDKNIKINIFIKKDKIFLYFMISKSIMNALDDVKEGVKSWGKQHKKLNLNFAM